MIADVTSILVTIAGQPEPLRFRGRLAWALDQLISAGARGCSTVANPAPRWSDYVFKIRKAGIDITTIDEPHGGSFPGRHARYRLAVPVTVVERGRS